MSFRFALLLALLSGVVVASLTSLNAAGIQLTLGRGLADDLPLLALLVGAFLGGAALVIVLGMLQQGRRVRRAKALDGIYRRRVQAEPGGGGEEAASTYEEASDQSPGHADAPAALDHHLRALRAEERVETLLAVANDYRGLGRTDDAIRTYQRVLARDRYHPAALHALRDLAVESGRWGEALQAEERLVRIVPREERAGEEAWLAGILYELGGALLAGGDAHGAASRFRDALRARSDFLPAALALGDAHLKTGDAREALRVWERALETQPAPPLLSRIEQLHRAAGRPARMVSLYADAARRHPEDSAIAFGLGRVYFELAMLDEAAEQFQKLEVREPDLPWIHAYLGAIFERRGQIRDAFEEYRRALRFPEGFQWLHRCAACGATWPRWFDRCPACRRWNTARS